MDSADDEPVAVVRGLDRRSTGRFCLKALLPLSAVPLSHLERSLAHQAWPGTQRSLVAPSQHATRKRPIAGGKPEPGIYRRASELVGAQNPIAVGDRLGIDIVELSPLACPPCTSSMVFTRPVTPSGAPRGQRPSYLAIDMRGLLRRTWHPSTTAMGT